MATNREVTKECIALAFYGIDVDVDGITAFYTQLTDWFESVGCYPDSLAVNGPGFSGMPVDFARANSRLKKRGFSGVRSFSIYSLLAGAGTPSLDWWATASVSLGRKSYFVVAARKSVVELDDENAVNLSAFAVEYLKPGYGIGYERDHDQGPAFYAIGLNQGIDASSDSESISRWGDVGMENAVYREGLLRDVYPQNYIQESHLMKHISGQSLKDWIGSKRSRGTLSPIDDRVTLWKIAPPQVESVKQSLSNCGVIFDWNEYIEGTP